MERTYGPARWFVKRRELIFYRCPANMYHLVPALLVALVLAVPLPLRPRGCRRLVRSTRSPAREAGCTSSLFAKPSRDVGARARAGLRQHIEYNRLDQADYLLDSEVLRLSFAASRDLGRRTFLLLSARSAVPTPDSWTASSTGTTPARHRDERAGRRPRDQFLYAIVLPDGRTVNRTSTRSLSGRYPGGARDPGQFPASDCLLDYPPHVNRT